MAPAPLRCMQRTHTSATRYLFTVIGLLAASCSDPASEGANRTSLELPSLTGHTVRLGRISTRCSQRSFDGMQAVAGMEMEFVAEDVAEMKPPCDDVAVPAVDVYLAGDSLILDFAQVEAPGVFADTEFDGYEIVVDRDCGDPVIASGTVERATSTVELRDDAIESHMDRLQINLAGIAFDTGSFIQIDLDVRDIACVIF